MLSLVPLIVFVAVLILVVAIMAAAQQAAWVALGLGVIAAFILGWMRGTAVTYQRLVIRRQPPSSSRLEIVP